jgi:hypothetical protein
MPGVGLNLLESRIINTAREGDMTGGEGLTDTNPKLEAIEVGILGVQAPGTALPLG